MTTTRQNGQENFLSLVGEFIAESSEALHGIESRTDSIVLAKDAIRLNRDARQATDAGISPFAQPASFLDVLIREAAPCHAADPSAAVSLSGAANTLHRGAQPLSHHDKKGSNQQTTSLPSHRPSLVETAKRLRAGETTCTQLAQAAVARALQTQSSLNAFLEIWADQALATAHLRDKELQAGHDRGLLHGIPLAHKDCFNIIGHAPTIGSKARSSDPCQDNARAIELLEQHGAVTIGTLNLSEMVAGPTGQNPVFGDCCNAVDPKRISGGSSSGSGAAVASGAVFGSMGSDTGGSVRIPASLNGLYGLKPTYGRVSRAGCFPRAHSVDCAGPLARSAQDCAALLQVVAGHDPNDPSTLKAKVPDYLSLLNVAGMGSRVAVLSFGDDEHYDPQINEVFENFIGQIEHQFGTVSHVSFPEVKRCNALSEVISKVEAATVHGQWMRNNPQAYSQSVFTRTETGLHIPAVRYLEALIVRLDVLESFIRKQFGDVDLLICPTIPIPAPLRSEIDLERADVTLNTVVSLTRLTRPFNYLGLPALTMPIGFDANGMPIGAQIIGRPLAEARILSFAHLMSQTMGN